MAASLLAVSLAEGHGIHLGLIQETMMRYGGVLAALLM